MNKTRRAKLEAQGWKVGSVQDFFGLSDEEAALVELKMTFGQTLRHWRTKSRLTQTELAKRLKSSQSRVAKMEAGDPSVSFDLLFRSLLLLGARPRDVARAITEPRQ
ncbi:MAG: helix-turn-helix transcriptional regulator [Gemmatimonadales bacterium]|nr:helix-turn-helix transcriptional regulator [Gemmatimonadales bacterium]